MSICLLNNSSMQVFAHQIKSGNLYIFFNSSLTILPQYTNSDKLNKSYSSVDFKSEVSVFI